MIVQNSTFVKCVDNYLKFKHVQKYHTKALGFKALHRLKFPGLDTAHTKTLFIRLSIKAKSLAWTIMKSNKFSLDIYKTFIGPALYKSGRVWSNSIFQYLPIFLNS